MLAGACLHIDFSQPTGTKLVPEDLEEAVIEQMDIVDRTPHVAVLYGAHPDHDPRPAFVRRDMVGVHDMKIGKLRDNMALVPNEPELVRAYEAKIAKESAAKQFILTEKDMRGVIAEFRELVTRLDRDLAATSKPWLFGERFTMADVFWAVSLFRMRWLGLGYLFMPGGSEPRPRVAAYCQALVARPSFRRAVIQWPNHPPSEHLPDLYPSW